MTCLWQPGASRTQRVPYSPFGHTQLATLARTTAHSASGMAGPHTKIFHIWAAVVRQMRPKVIIAENVTQFGLQATLRARAWRHLCLCSNCCLGGRAGLGHNESTAVRLHVSQATDLHLVGSRLAWMAALVCVSLESARHYRAGGSLAQNWTQPWDFRSQKRSLIVVVVCDVLHVARCPWCLQEQPQIGLSSMWKHHAFELGGRPRKLCCTWSCHALVTAQTCTRNSASKTPAAHDSNRPFTRR